MQTQRLHIRKAHMERRNQEMPILWYAQADLEQHYQGLPVLPCAKAFLEWWKRHLWGMQASNPSLEQLKSCMPKMCKGKSKLERSQRGLWGMQASNASLEWLSFVVPIVLKRDSKLERRKERVRRMQGSITSLECHFLVLLTSSFNMSSALYSWRQIFHLHSSNLPRSSYVLRLLITIVFLQSRLSILRPLKILSTLMQWRLLSWHSNQKMRANQSDLWR